MNNSNLKRAEIVNNRVHWIFEADDYPDPNEWGPYPDGTKPLIVDLINGFEDARIDDGYNPNTGNIIFKPRFDEDDNPVFRDMLVEWDESEYKFNVIFKESPTEDSGIDFDGVSLDEIKDWVLNEQAGPY